MENFYCHYLLYIISTFSKFERPNVQISKDLVFEKRWY